MADMQIEIRGLNKLNNYFIKLGPELNRQVIKTQKEFASFVQKSAKLRAPQGPTGALKNSIKVYPGKKNEIRVTVESPYAYFQEFGFRPHLIFPNMDNRLGIRLSDLGFTHPVWVSKHTSFVQPAIEMGLNKLPLMLEKAADKAVKGE